MTRTVFFISDGTGITAETLGRSLMSQFEAVTFDYVTIPNVTSAEKAQYAIRQITESAHKNGKRPIVFTTLVNNDVRQLLTNDQALFIDFFQTFISPLEQELGEVSSHAIGRSHGMKNLSDYMARINAVNYALAYDDGLNQGDYQNADVIVTGVSRCGKTPTCLFLGLQYGVYAANYPITEEEIGNMQLPKSLVKFKSKLVGLTISPERLTKIRQERLPHRRYAQLRQCQKEVHYAESLFKANGIAYLDTTTRSIEELAAEIMSLANIKRRIK